jgi:hypothetical protein
VTLAGPDRLVRLALGALLLLLAHAGCRTGDGGLPGGWSTNPGPVPDAATDGRPDDGGDGGDAADVGDVPIDMRRRDAPPLLNEAPPGVAGPPEVVGCADGTREGFPDPTAWRRIAGCAGTFTLPGLTGPVARAPQCGRLGGNSSAKPPAGVQCSVSDLCAEGWHVCENGEDVRRSSPTECESAAPEGYVAFFVTRASATPYGLCIDDVTQANDLHGCGNLGQPEASGCQPLDRRLTFVECFRSLAWSCGDETGHLDEGNRVTKPGAGQGGALCCRDAPPGEDSDSSEIGR